MGKKQQQDMMSSWCDNVIINEIIAVWDIWLDAVGMAVYYYIFVGSKTAFSSFFIKNTTKSKNMYGKMSTYLVHYFLLNQSILFDFKLLL